MTPPIRHGCAATLVWAITQVVGSMPAVACEPPMPNVIRLNPFVVQGAATLSEKDRPLLPRNVDFRIDVLHVDRVDAASFVLRADARLKTDVDIPLPAQARGDVVTVHVHASSPLRAGVGYSVYGVLAGQRQRVFQFQTAAAEDRAAPSSVQVSKVTHLGNFTPMIGLCDNGHARLLLNIVASDDSTATDQLRYEIEGQGEPQLQAAWCRRLEIALSPSTRTGVVRITAIDLAGNRGPTATVAIPPAVPGSWETLRRLQTCEPAR